MKNYSFHTLTSLIAIGAIIFTGCTGHKHEEASEAKSTDTVSAAAPAASAPQFQVDVQFQKQLTSVFQSYVELKDAFVSSDAAKVKSAASAATGELKRVDMTLLSGAAHNDWMTYVSSIEKSLQDIQSATDIEQQRRQFSTVSDNLYKSIKAFGLADKEAFYDFCPMAFDNRGAYWLSDNSQIRNPYFGDKMLTCGSVKEKIQ